MWATQPHWTAADLAAIRVHTWIVDADHDEAIHRAKLADCRRAELCTTTVSEAEIAHGLALLPKGRRRDALAQAIARLLGEGLGGRVLPFDRAAAAAFGEIAASRRAAGRPIATADGQIAAIARSSGATLIATRDRGGFEGCGLALADPWTG